MELKKYMYSSLFVVILLQVAIVATAQTGVLLVTPDGRALTGGGGFIFAAPAAPGSSNATPVASSVLVQGSIVVGQPLNVSFTYTDMENDPQGATSYQWYRADDAAGSNSTAIGGATTDAYVLTTADQGKYITAGVTPKAIAGTSPGLEAKATYLGPVTAVAGCPATVVVNHVAGDVSPETVSITYEVVETTLFSGTPKCAITRNLGATTQAASAADATAASAGWYWQFNRKQGYKHDGATRTPNTTWISSINESGDWLPANDPCTLLLGTGWRLPTFTEWMYADGDSGGKWENNIDAYNSVLKIHVAGYLSDNTGASNDRGVTGCYWSSSQFDINTDGGLNLILYSTTSTMYFSVKASGFSVRCLKD